MPPRDPTTIQLDFPVLVADIIAQLQLTGTVGLLEFSPVVIPVYIVGDRDLKVEAVQPVFQSTEIFSGDAGNPVAGAVVVDTGQLPAGDYDIQLHGSLAVTAGGPQRILFTHRNAANTADLASWSIPMADTAANSKGWTFGYRLAENERIRLNVAVNTTGRVAGEIFARLRPAP